jgi:ribosomal protein L23
MSVDATLLQYLVRPIFTEKSYELSQQSQYVFEVSDVANKIQLKQAFEMAFDGRKVTDVRLVKTPAKTRRFGKRTVAVPAKRKAIFSVVGDPLPMFSVEGVDNGG